MLVSCAGYVNEFIQNISFSNEAHSVSGVRLKRNCPVYSHQA